MDASTDIVGFALWIFSAGMTEFLVPELGNLTATAILGWYAWHTASKTIPSLVKDFRDEMAAARAEFTIEREAFRQQMTEERCFRHADSTAVVEALHELTSHITPISARARSAFRQPPVAEDEP